MQDLFRVPSVLQTKMIQQSIAIFGCLKDYSHRTSFLHDDCVTKKENVHKPFKLKTVQGTSFTQKSYTFPLKGIAH